MTTTNVPRVKRTQGRLRADWKRNRAIYLMFLPVLIYYLVFHYAPMYGAVIAFKNYIPSKGIFDSAWVGL